jgi:hypothetical protein
MMSPPSPTKPPDLTLPPPSQSRPPSSSMQESSRDVIVAYREGRIREELLLIPSEWNDQRAWIEITRSVLGNKDWTHTVEGLSPLATKRERSIDTQFFYQ